MNMLRSLFNVGNRGMLQQLFPFRKRANRGNGFLLTLLALTGATIFGMTRKGKNSGIVNQVVKPFTNQQKQQGQPTT